LSWDAKSIDQALVAGCLGTNNTSTRGETFGSIGIKIAITIFAKLPIACISVATACLKSGVDWEEIDQRWGRSHHQVQNRT
jgi:hypothetical protein